MALIQEGFRFGLDDGNEASHTWAIDQDTNLSTAENTKRLVRIIVDTDTDIASTAYKLKYQKNGSGGYVDVPLTSTTKIRPVIEPADSTSSGNNTAEATWAVSTPTASTGDLLIFCITWDNSTNTTDVTEPAGKNGETILEVNATPALSSGSEVRSKVWYVKCTGAWTAGTITFTPSATESWTAKVIRVPAGEFDATTPIGAVDTEASVASETAVKHGAFSAGASDGSGALCVWTGVDVDPQTVATGFSEVAHTDIGIISGGFYTRDANVTDSESFSATTVSTIAGDTWCSVAFVVRAPTITNDVYVVASANITAGGENTTARLTAPTGKSGNFTTGRRWDDENGTDSIDIATSFYTELEWSLSLNTGLTLTHYYEFRVYEVNTVFGTYSLTPRWTVSDGSIEGTSAITLGSTTLSSSGTVSITGTSSVTLGSTTLSSSGTVSITGTSSVTLDNITLASNSVVDVVGNSSVTLDDMTLSASGTVEESSITGTSAITLGDVTVSSNGVVDIVGNLSKTLDNVILSSSGLVDIVGSSSVTLENATLSSSGTVSITGTLATTLGNTTLASNGVVDIVGTSAITLDDITLSASGTSGGGITGTSNITLGDVTSTATGIVGDDIVLSLSSNITTGGTQVTTALLIPPSGKTTGDFQEGRISDDTNPVQSITIVADKYTEIEFSIKATGLSATDGVYRFRLTDNGTPISTYPIYPTVTIVAGVEGTSNITLGDTTLSATGAVSITGNSSVTLDNTTSSASGSVAINGTLSKTLDDVTLTGSGVVEVDGSLNSTLGDTTSSSTGTVSIDGSSAITLGNTTVSSSGDVDVVGNLTTTLGDVTLSATGVIGAVVTGTANITLDNVTLSSSGNVVVSGVSNITLGDVSVSSSGTVGISGNANITLDEITVLSTATVSIIGTSNVTLGGTTSGSNGAVLILGNSDNTLNDILVSADGLVTITGNLAKTLAGITLNGIGTVTTGATGTGSISLDNITISATGSVFDSPSYTANMMITNMFESSTNAVLSYDKNVMITNGLETETRLVIIKDENMQIIRIRNNPTNVG